MSTQRPPIQAITVHEIPWAEPLPGALQKTIWQKPMGDNPSTSRRMSMIKYKPGSRMPAERQLGDELVYVVEGTFSDGSGTIAAGSACYYPTGCITNRHSVHGATVVSLSVGGAERSGGEARGPASQIINVNELPWQDVEGGRASMKVIWKDDSADRRFLLAWLSPGMTQPLHEHVGEELIFLLEGCLVDEAGALTPGNLGYRPYRCYHSFTTKNGALGLVYIWGKTVNV